MSDREEKRKFKRLGTNWGVKIRATRYAEAAVREMQERIKNISVGGIFIETAQPMPVGTHVEFSFSMPETAGEIHAKGIVRWSNDGRLTEEPVGMGIEFLEVSQHHKEAIGTYVRKEVSREVLEPLLLSELHRNLLRYYFHRLGDTVLVEGVTQYLGCSPVDLLDVLKDFLKAKLVSYSKESVTFLRTKNAELAQAIDHWCKGPGATP